MSRPYRIAIEADSDDAKGLASLLMELALEIQAGTLSSTQVVGGASRSSIVHYWTPETTERPQPNGEADG